MEDQNYVTLLTGMLQLRETCLRTSQPLPCWLKPNLCSPPYPLPPASKECTTLAIGVVTTLAIGVVSSRPTLGEEIT